MAVLWTPSIGPLTGGTGGATTVTFTGIVFAAGIAVVAIGVADGGPVTAVTLNGVVAAPAAQSGHTGAAPNYTTELWYASVNAGTGSVVVTTTTNEFGCNVGGGILTGAAPTPGTPQVIVANNSNTSFGNPITTSAIIIPSGGIGLAAVGTAQAGSTCTFNIGTKDFTITNGTNLLMAAGNITASGSQIPSFNSNYDGGIVVVPWAPAPASSSVGNPRWFWVP